MLHSSCIGPLLFKHLIQVSEYILMSNTLPWCSHVEMIRKSESFFFQKIYAMENINEKLLKKGLIAVLVVQFMNWIEGHSDR